MWTRWGRVGDPFRSSSSALKDFDNEAAARKEYAKTMREKTNKGYQVGALFLCLVASYLEF
jgi:predicted DNA-binding WGR domain protein